MPAGIDYFGRGHPLEGLQELAARRMRRRIYEWFRAGAGDLAGRAVLDYGSTPDTARRDSNCFIRWLLEDGARVYAASPEDVSHLPLAFPGLTVAAWPVAREQLPPLDHVISSAVIEHVGGEADQVDFLAGLLALGGEVLVTTPNRFHWLEFHTKLPLLHWLPRRWHRAALAALGQAFWAEERNLRLLSRADLAGIVAAAVARARPGATVDWFCPRFLGMTSNLVVRLR